ncbi:glutamyl aminopeptidase [Trichonephila inaurata madagascariensis]|uniref:Glutamyl aminopeptidase n=1 Tax=Trichonephila inaurata madagascariensis TaxID=2747483 RepID=A0A8X6ICA3_9ARAC|nr:glutamyl aminopeptidase [Trichonephila inaurata madagascariensis]
MSRVNSVIMGNVTERNKTSGPKNTFFRILRRVQIGVLIIGTLLFLAWCFSYLLHDTRTNSKSNSFKSASLIALEKDCCGAGDKAEHKEDEDIGLLPGNVVPHHYNLTLQLFMPPQYNFTTRGNVEILIECIRETKIRLFERKRPIQPLLSIGTIELINVPLEINIFEVMNTKGNWIASTQFQPSDARRVFPCFDEPSLKATIRLSLICNKNAIALSNMPQTKTESLYDDWKLVSFMESPRMSTYTFSFIVGQIKPFTEERGKGIQIWSRNDMVQYGELAHEITPVILRYLEEYIEVPFTMPKLELTYVVTSLTFVKHLDLVAVPSFLHAAMENWGLITFDESALLFNPNKSSTENRVFVTLVIGHELAHQWFGNLVTASWWDSIWLNEGFATYYEYIGVDRLQPQWNIVRIFFLHIL